VGDQHDRHATLLAEDVERVEHDLPQVEREDVALAVAELLDALLAVPLDGRGPDEPSASITSSKDFASGKRATSMPLRPSSVCTTIADGKRAAKLLLPMPCVP
jgi:hypothetical protein